MGVTGCFDEIDYVWVSFIGRLYNRKTYLGGIKSDIFKPLYSMYLCKIDLKTNKLDAYKKPIPFYIIWPDNNKQNYCSRLPKPIQ